MQQSATFRNRLISILIVLAVGLALYAPSLGLMLFSDDAPHMQWLNSQQGGSYWVSSEGFPVYRPATFAAWDALVNLLGGPNALAFHALSVLLHVMNGLLVGEIALCLTGQRKASLMAGLFFVAFPFSYGAVILAAAQFHLWQVFGLLAGSRMLLGWLDAKRGWWQLAIAWLLIGWAVFQHENGVLSPVLVGGIAVVAYSSSLQKDWKRLALALGPVIALAVVYLVLRSLAIKITTGGLQLAGFEVKIGQTLQVLGFPLAALLRLAFSPENGLALAWLSGIAFLVAALLLARWQWNRGEQYSALASLSLLGGGWFFMAMLPAWLFVPVDYLLGSVRLHYLASVGLVWAYAAILADLLPQSTNNWRRWVIGGLGLGMYLAIAVPFIWARQAEFRKMDTVYRDIGQLARQMTIDYPQAPTSSLMVLNGPSVESPVRLTFLLGSEGSVYLPGYVSLESLLWVNSFISQQRPLEVEMRHAPDISPAIAVDAPELDRSTLQDFDSVIAVQDLGRSLHAVVVGEQLSANTPSIAPLADFENGVILQAGELTQLLDTAVLVPASMRNANPAMFAVTLDWVIISPLQQPVEIFVHLLCNTEPISQADGPPLGRSYPFALWQPGERWRDVRYITLPNDIADACLNAVVGLYDPATGNRIMLTDSTGHSVDSITLGISGNN